MAAVAKQRHASMPHNSNTDRRAFGSLNSNPTTTTKAKTGEKIKSFFRIASITKSSAPETSAASSDTDSVSRDREIPQEGGEKTPPPTTQQTKSSHGSRHSRFLPHIGRNRSTTVASEGHPLDDAMSPTANVNPYFQHQGPPALRHHNDSSVPPSPPDTPGFSKKIDKPKDAHASGGKEELARKLRRVASAPNAQGLFSKSQSKSSSDSRPHTAAFDLPLKTNGPLGVHGNASALSMVETAPQNGELDLDLLPVPVVNGELTPGKIRNAVAFRRTYSSNSIKVRNVEVGPSSFDKIKLIGKGDVGKVYLVREKKSSRLYAMKGGPGPRRST